jgi:hypothetical protein
MIHMYTGKEIQRDTKTACGTLLENLPRAHASVPYKRRAQITCAACQAKADKTARMRGE